MALRFEVWTRPESGTFERKFPIKVETQHNLALGVFGHGLLVLPSDYPRLDDILYTDKDDHSNDVAALIRVFHGDVWVHDFYAARMVNDVNETGRRTVNVTGPGLGASLVADCVPIRLPTQPDGAAPVGVRRREHDPRQRRL